MSKLSKKPWLTLKSNQRNTLLNNHTDTVQAIATALQASTSVLIGTHEHPDGDALGSSLSLYHVLKDLGKDVTVYTPDPAPDFFSFLPGFDQVTSTKPDTSTFDAIVLLDCTQLYRAHLEKEVLAHNNTIVIDHHHGNLGQATHNMIIPEAAATSYILFALYQATGMTITKDVATCLLTGIFTDTGSFMHDSVTPELLEVSSFLMNKGARLSHIAHETYQRKDLPGLKIWGRALSRILINEQTGAAVSVVTLKDLEECGANLDDLDGVVNMLNTLPQTRFALLLTEYEPGSVKGSLRSEPHKGVDVSKIAKMLGGGGHKLASGFEVQGHIVNQDGKWRIVPPELTNA